MNKKKGLTKWEPFPNPEKNGFLYATIGPGLYRVRDKNDKKYDYLCIGIGKKDES